MGLLLVAGLWVWPALLPAQESTTRFINESLAKAWKKERLEPSAKCSDHEFLRRALLDLIGRIASIDEVLDFEKDDRPDKRARLIDRLLASEEYAKHWADVWTRWLLEPAWPPKIEFVERSGGQVELVRHPHWGDYPVFREQLRLWLEEQLAKNVSHKELTEKLITATGKSTENPAVHFILAHVGEPLSAAQKKEDGPGQFNMAPITLRTLQLFLGQRLEYVLHPDGRDPSRDWRQSDFWGVTVFFRQVERVGNPAADPRTPVVELRENSSFCPNEMIFFELPGGAVLSTRSVYLGGRRLPANLRNERRKALAGLITNDVQFSRAWVNRLWAHFFGRGLNEQRAFDDFGSQNPVLHPEILERLTKDLVASGYDSKKLIGWICTSDAYSLSSTSNWSNEKEVAAPYFSRMLLKPMSPEQLLESLRVAIEGKPRGWKQDKDRDERAERLRALPIFRGAQDDMLAALGLMHGREFNNSINRKADAAVKLMPANPRALMNHLFLAALNRRAADLEYKTMMDKAKMRVPDKDPAAFWHDLFWALLNSNEFILNH